MCSVIAWARSKAVVLCVFLLALPAGQGAAASVPGVPAAVPADYQRLYVLLESQLAAIHPGPQTHGSATRVGAELQLADGNRGAALLQPNAVAQVGLEVAELQRLGVNAVTVSVAYPILDPAFPQQRRYLSFYRQVARMVHRRGMTLAVDAADALSGTPFSAVRWSYPYPTVESYAVAKGRMARLVIGAMHPRFLTLEGQPDTETIVTGLPLADPVTYASAVSVELKQIGPHLGTLLGAGPGSWSPPSYDRELARIGGLDYLDTQVLPTDAQAIANVASAARIAHDAHKAVVMDSAWLFKGPGPSPLALARTTNFEAHELNDYRFVAPLDQQFLRKLIALTRAERFAYVSASYSSSFATYLTYTASTASDSLWKLSSRYQATVAPALADHRISTTGRTFATLIR